MKNIIKTLLIIATVSIANSNLILAESSAAQFLKLGAGARPAAMGEAFTSISDDVTAGYWNPAGLAQISQAQISMMHNSALVDTQYQYAAAAMPMGSNVVAASLYRMNYGSIDAYSNTDVKTGSFDAGSTAASLSFARSINDNLKLGMNVKHISETIDTVKASAFAADFGVFLKERKLNRFNFGFSVKNLGSGLKFVKETESLPRILQGGVSTQFFDNKMTSALELSKSSDNDATLHLGTEYKVNTVLIVRGGYKTTPSNNIDVDGLTNISAGMGLQINQLAFDYAFIPFGDLGSSHKVSLLFRFSSSQN